jgi:hypothetical protein
MFVNRHCPLIVNSSLKSLAFAASPPKIGAARIGKFFSTIRNGVVDAADYTVWRNALDRRGNGLAADGNGDNSVTQAHCVVWKIHFGETAGSGSAATAATVPEPNGVILLIFGSICWRVLDRTDRISGGRS